MSGTGLKPLPAAVFIAPMAVLGFGILPMTYGFYTFLRLVVFGCAAWIAYRRYRDGQTNWAVGFGLLAVAYNPLIPVFLSRPIWLPIDLFAIWFFWKARKREAAS